ncbi:MAG: hypothetical protein IPK13_05485 [Deltaproteobacteria bacterium]|nr:hypothetical protein [Deltaproteobacteria bacterium]
MEDQKLEDRRLGGVQSRDGRHARVVDKFVDHGAPLSFGALSLAIVPPTTRYLVLDLDRTTHLGRNLGELLGWELCAHLAYGPERLAELEAHRRGRFCFDWSHPWSLVRYLCLGIRLWAYAGLYYLAWGKIGARLDGLRRRAYRRFGTEPIREVQRVPQTALFHQLSMLPLDTLRNLARNVWMRHRSDQVIEREDLEALRARCPNLRIILSSASPTPMVEVAAEMLGADDFFASAIDEHDGYLSAPFGGHRLLKLEREPRRLSPPSKIHFNASYAKIRRIVERYPDFCDPEVIKVGMTDNGYGEDQCWTEFFNIVADLNSNTPFSPIVTPTSPLFEVHSARVLTHAERATGRLDARRKLEESKATARQLDDNALRARLGAVLAEIEDLASRYEASATSIASALARVKARTSELRERIETQVRNYNEDHGPERRAVLGRIRSALSEELDLRRQIARIERPVSELAYALTKQLEYARASL